MKMKVALYGKGFPLEIQLQVVRFCESLSARGISLCCTEALYPLLNGTGANAVERPEGCDLIISLGGDGTFLDAVVWCGVYALPVLGVNLGRLGFLTSVTMEDALAAVDAFVDGRYRLEERDTLQLFGEAQAPFADFPYALNELSVFCTENSSLLTIEARVGGCRLTTYWADGLIVATPTGSTAYSLSCGGPILTPRCQNLLLTSVAAHNLSLRPVVVPMEDEIELNIHSRSGDFLLGLDSRRRRMCDDVAVRVKSGHFRVKMVVFDDNVFFDTLRRKLRWGDDLRNDR